MTKKIYPCRTLTVIIRNDSPWVNCNSAPTYRSVHVELTQEQIDKLALNWAWSCGDTRHYEEVAQCFIEPVVSKE